MPVLARAFLLLSLVLTLVGAVVFGIATRRVKRIYDLPAPPISRALQAEEIARGGRLFRTDCLDCHAGPAAPAQTGERRPTGGRVTGAPAFLGEIWAPNLTNDRETGIAAWSDGQLARLLRNGLRRDGRYAATMPRFARLSDADVAAVIGFLRSDDRLVAPVRNDVPRPGLAVAGTLALAFAAGVDVGDTRAVPMPPRAPSADYGRYLASAVYGCVDCHTEGFISTEEKLRAPTLLAGGQFHRSPRGEPIYSTNLTSDRDTGLRNVTSPQDFWRLLTSGVRGDGLPVRPPMPVFRYLDAEEAAALLAYLRAVPAVSRKTPGPEREPLVLTAAPSRLFVTLGCSGCHGEGAPQHPVLKQAATRDAAGIAAAIRHPEQQRPATQMPTYAAVLDADAAMRLALWVKETGGRGR